MKKICIRKQTLKKCTDGRFEKTNYFDLKNRKEFGKRYVKKVCGASAKQYCYHNQAFKTI